MPLGERFCQNVWRVNMVMSKCSAATWLALAVVLAAGWAGVAPAEEPRFDPEGEWRAHVIEVSADAHEAGEYTLQDAFNDLPETGGTVALGEGEFVVARVSAPEGRPIVMKGKGPDTVVKAESNQTSITFHPTPHLEVTGMAFSGHRRALVLADGAYGHIKIHNAQFSDISLNAIQGVMPGPVQRLTVTECRFENVNLAVNFRVNDARNMEVSNNAFYNIGTRPIIVGARSGDQRYARIMNNHIEGVGPGRHPIGILSYVDYTVIAGNTLMDIHGEARHEGISSRGGNTVIWDNKMVNAGGHTAAISLAGSGPTLILKNVIRFTDEHKGHSWNGMDLRQRQVQVVGNEITGTTRGVVSRRGIQGMLIKDNFIGDSPRQIKGIRICISTGAVIPKESMGGLTIRNNTFSNIAKEEGDGGFQGVLFNIVNHRGEHDTRMDDVVIAGNVFKDIDVADGSAGVHFTELYRETSHMRNVRIVGNDFGDIDVPVTEAKQHVEELHIADE